MFYKWLKCRFFNKSLIFKDKLENLILHESLSLTFCHDLISVFSPKVRIKYGSLYSRRPGFFSFKFNSRRRRVNAPILIILRVYWLGFSKLLFLLYTRNLEEIKQTLVGATWFACPKNVHINRKCFSRLYGVFLACTKTETFI